MFWKSRNLNQEVSKTLYIHCGIICVTNIMLLSKVKILNTVPYIFIHIICNNLGNLHIIWQGQINSATCMYKNICNYWWLIYSCIYQINLTLGPNNYLLHSWSHSHFQKKWDWDDFQFHDMDQANMSHLVSLRGL